MKTTTALLALFAGMLASAGAPAFADYEGCISEADRAFSECAANANSLSEGQQVQDAMRDCNIALATSRQACEAEGRAGAPLTGPEDQPQPPEQAPQPPEQAQQPPEQAPQPPEQAPQPPEQAPQPPEQPQSQPDQPPQQPD